MTQKNTLRTYIPVDHVTYLLESKTLGFFVLFYTTPLILNVPCLRCLLKWQIFSVFLTIFYQLLTFIFCNKSYWIQHILSWYYYYFWFWTIHRNCIILIIQNYKQKGHQGPHSWFLVKLIWDAHSDIYSSVTFIYDDVSHWGIKYLNRCFFYILSENRNMYSLRYKLHK